jgi:hypothetical protein
VNDFCTKKPCIPEPYYKDPMEQFNDHKDYFTKAAPKKEKRMNLYTLSASKISTVEFVEVEAECEDDAIRKVEFGDVDPDYDEFEEYQGIEVTDTILGDKEMYAKLGCNFVIRSAEVAESNLADALYTLLQKFDGMTVQYNDAELELVGFSVDHVEEA